MTDWRLKDSVDAILLRCITGLRAVTFQNYTEVNVKTGAQRDASSRYRGDCDVLATVPHPVSRG